MIKESLIVNIYKISINFFFEILKDDFKLMYSHIFALIEKKCIKPVIGQVYPLKNATKAQQDIVSNRGATGRLTLKIQP